MTHGNYRLSVNAGRSIRRRGKPPVATHRGVLLPMVLVVLVLLISITYRLGSWSLSQAINASAFVHNARAAEAAASGVRLAFFWGQQKRLAGMVTSGSGGNALAGTDGTGTFGLPTDDDPTTCFMLVCPGAGKLAIGVEDESGKLALNSIPLDSEHQERSREILMRLPGVTIQIADAILDWLDEDSDVREFGAEANSYSAAGLPLPRNGRLSSLDELLNVRGITPYLLFGEDQNRDGIIDRQEDDGDGIGNRGLSGLVSLNAAESNRMSDGAMKINVNDVDAAAIYDSLSAAIGIEESLFLAALRRYGPVDLASAIDNDVESQAERRATVDERIVDQLGLNDSGTSAPGALSNQGQRGGSRNDERAGIELGGKPIFRIRSWADVCGVTVKVSKGGTDTNLLSPWSGDVNGFAEAYKTLERIATLYDAPIVEGRIAAHSAPWQVLSTLPSMTINEAKAIRSRAIAISNKLGEIGGSSKNPIWLVEEGLVDFDKFRELLPFLTAGGDVLTVRSFGFSANGKHCILEIATSDIARGHTQVLRRTSGLSMDTLDLMVIPDQRVNNRQAPKK
jgi:hypothetical protein